MRLAFIVAFAFSGAARADDGASAHDTLVARPADDPTHLVYAELFGKAGEYGIGYEHAITPRLSLGAAGSFAVVRGEQIATFAPYVHARLLGHENALFSELGAVIAHTRVPSPVADWNGMSDTGGGGFVSLGYEHATRHVVLRAAGSLMVGEGGFGPAIGFAIGVRP